MNMEVNNLGNLTWLEAVEASIDRIAAIVERLPAEARGKCFELLMSRLLETTRPSQEEMPTVAPTDATEKAERGPSTWQRFLSDHELTKQDVENFVELETGQPLLAVYPRTKAEAQRVVAALLALAHFYRDGEPIVPKDELVKQCKQLGIYDSANLMKNIRNTTTDKGVQVFTFDKGKKRWRATGPGYEYLAQVIKSRGKDYKDDKR